MKPSLEELFRRLSETHGNKWMLWPNYKGEFVGQIHTDTERRETVGPFGTLHELLVEMSGYKFMLRLKRKPALPPAIERFTVVKSGGRHELLLDGSVSHGKFATKTEALKAATDIINKTHYARDEWDSYASQILGGLVEGVDYIFVD